MRHLVDKLKSVMLCVCKSVCKRWATAGNGRGGWIRTSDHLPPRLRNYQRLITTERCLVKDFKESYRSAQVPKSVKVAPNNYVTLRQLNFQVCANRVCKWPGSPMGCPAFFYSKLKGGRRNES